MPHVVTGNKNAPRWIGCVPSICAGKLSSVRGSVARAPSLPRGAVGRVQYVFHRVQQRINLKWFRQRGCELKRRVSGQLVRGQSSGGHDDREGHSRSTEHLDQFNAGQVGYLVLGDQKMVVIGLKCGPAGCAIRGAVNVVADAS